MTEVGYASDKPSDCAYCYFFSAGRKKCERKECFYRISSPPLRRKVTILGNCDTMLFLGGKESSTLKEISETLGKETIDLYNTSDTRGQSRSYGMNYQKTGKELMSRDELAVMDGSKCILQLRGVRPFFSDKFDITKHKRYKELSDYDKKNEFDVEAYMRHRMEVKLTRTQEFDLYEFSEERLAEELNTENKEAEHVKDSDT